MEVGGNTNRKIQDVMCHTTRLSPQESRSHGNVEQPLGISSLLHVSRASRLLAAPWCLLPHKYAMNMYVEYKRGQRKQERRKAHGERGPSYDALAPPANGNGRPRILPL